LQGPGYLGVVSDAPDRLDLSDVYDPLPWTMVLGLAALITGGLWTVMDWAARLAVELFATQVTTGAMSWASALAACAAVLVGMAGLTSYLWSDQTGLVAERTHDTLRLESHTRLATRAVEVPLADIRELRLEERQLVLRTERSRRTVRLPGRHPDAHALLEAFVARLGQ
jgi:hypothetical protein